MELLCLPDVCNSRSSSLLEANNLRLHSPGLVALFSVYATCFGRGGGGKSWMEKSLSLSLILQQWLNSISMSRTLSLLNPLAIHFLLNSWGQMHCVVHLYAVFTIYTICLQGISSFTCDQKWMWWSKVKHNLTKHFIVIHFKRKLSQEVTLNIHGFESQLDCDIMHNVLQQLFWPFLSREKLWLTTSLNPLR